MKPKPLDLEVEHIYVNDLAKATIDMIIQGLTTKNKVVDSKEEAIVLIFDLVQEIVDIEIKQRIKSACEFWLRYKDRPELLVKEHPEYKTDAGFRRRYLMSVYHKNQPEWLSKYNEWLFKLAFRDVFKERGK